MGPIIGFLLAVIPILVVFAGLVFFKKGGTFMGIVGWILTLAIAILFFNTSPEIAVYASLAGVLASFSIALMVLFTILQVTMMDVTGAIRSITAFVKTIAAERYEQIMLLNVGLGTFLVSIGATPVTMLPPIMIALGFSPLAAIALPCLGYDPLTSFSLLAVPIKAPADTFGLDANQMAINVSLFLPVVATGLSMGMLWVADGWAGVKKGFVPSIVAGLTLGLSAIAFVRLFPAYMNLTGVFGGLMAVLALLLLRVARGKPIFIRAGAAGKHVAADGGDAPVMPLWRALSPWVLLVLFCVVISVPEVNRGLYDALGGVQKIHITGDQSVDLKLLTQAYVWVLVSTVLSAPLLIRNRAEAVKTLKVWLKRAWSPTVAAAVFFAIAYVMFWSAKSVDPATGRLVAADMSMNMNYVIGAALATGLGAFLFPLVSPLLGLFGGFVSGSETSSNVMFYKILEAATDKLATASSRIDLMKVFAGHAVAGGIASGIAVAKIVNAAAVIDKIGMEGEVIRKSAAVIIVLTLITGLMLAAWTLF
ncbi:MAG: glycolate transporter [Methanocella sp. PtaU1.Bin125]|nr:MAG: glycolate transporter [Methanocella sp. PtaU1.Bin125]